MVGHETKKMVWALNMEKLNSSERDSPAFGFRRSVMWLRGPEAGGRETQLQAITEFTGRVRKPMKEESG